MENRGKRRMVRMEGRSQLQRLSHVVLAMALVPGLLGMASSFWLTSHTASESYHLGLWNSCQGSSCQPYSADDVLGWFNVVRGLCLVALSLHVFALAFAYFCARLGTRDLMVPSLLRTEEASAFVAGALMGGGMGMFAQSSNKHPVFHTLSFGWSFWMCLTHVCLLIICSGVIALSRGSCACHKPCSRKRNTRYILYENPPIVHTPLHSDAAKASHDSALGKDSTNQVDKDSGKTLLGRLKQAESPQQYSSLEGLPRMLQKLSGKRSNDSEHIV